MSPDEIVETKTSTRTLLIYRFSCPLGSLYIYVHRDQVSLILNKVVERGIEGKMGSNGYLPLFETRPARGLVLFRLYVASIFIGICFIWFFRVSYFPVEGKTERWAWVGIFLAELWFSFYFFITLVVRWNPVFRYTFKNRLSSRSLLINFLLPFFLFMD